MGLEPSDREAVAEILRCISDILSETRRVSSRRPYWKVADEMPDVVLDLGELCTHARTLSRGARRQAPGVPWAALARAESLVIEAQLVGVKKPWGEIRAFLEQVGERILPLYDRIGARWHPWRKCPQGRFWSSHDGSQSFEPQCVWDASAKDRLHPDEIHAIAQKHFKKLTDPYGLTESPTNKPIGFRDGNKYDKLIQGWCQYWNDVLCILHTDPQHYAYFPIETDVVKALMASESGFKPDPKHHSLPNGDPVRGIMQLTGSTVRNLKNERGEMKDHYVVLDLEDTLNPTLSICAGVRWLFQKQKLAFHNLKRPPTGPETVAHYKGCLRPYVAGRNPVDMRPFTKCYNDLQKKD